MNPHDSSDVFARLDAERHAGRVFALSTSKLLSRCSAPLSLGRKNCFPTANRFGYVLGMSDSIQGQGAPESPSSFAPSPDASHRPPAQKGEGGAEGLPIDLEIDALLEFEPVPRKVKRPDGWTPDLQREFIHRLALTGSPKLAVVQMGKNISGIEAVYKDKRAESFRFAWDSALELGQRRAAEREQGVGYAGRAPGLNVRSPSPGASHHPLPQGGEGQVLNEFGEWEDEESMRRRAEDVSDSIRRKLLRCRRLYLSEISGSPGKRAAFEVLTELPIDWDKAARLEPQDDEPYNPARMRNPDMVLTAESGWLAGQIGYGPDRKRQARESLNAYLIEQGHQPVDWSESSESTESSE